MAGPILHPKAHSERSLPPFARRNMVEASVTILGQTYRTIISEGATTEELIGKVARENGGGVARVYYPEFKTWEIVAVKIGNELLVKGDPARVSEADFSRFSDPAAVRRLALSYARKSEGGIHFSIGSSGIPLAMTEDQGIVFPNAEELRIGRTTSNIALWMTSVNIDPQTISELDREYSGSGGLSASMDALRKISESHGGVRSDRLMLEDNILILNKDTGELLTASQHAMQPGQMDTVLEYAPAYIATQGADAPIAQALQPEASIARIPYLSVLVFDGRIADVLRVRLSPLLDPGALGRAATEPERIATVKIQKAPSPGFALLSFPPADIPAPPPQAASGPAHAPPRSLKPPRAARREGGAPASQAKAARPITIPSPEMILRSWLKKREEALRLEIPASVSPLEAALEGPSIPAGKRKKRRRGRAPMRGSAVFRPEKKATKKDPPPDPGERKKAKGPKDRRRRERRAKPPVPGKGTPPKGAKRNPAEEPRKKATRRKDRGAPGRGGPLSEGKRRISPKPEKRPGNASEARKGAKRQADHLRRVDALIRKDTARKGIARKAGTRPEQGRRKRMDMHSFYNLIGLFQRKRRGRKFSTKKARAE